MCDYFYNAFGELTKNKPNLKEGFQSSHRCVDTFVDLPSTMLPTMPSTMPSGVSPQSSTTIALLPDKPPAIMNVKKATNCSYLYPLEINGKCGRSMEVCIPESEVMSDDKKYCLKQ